jgi:hypothetical protein
MIAVFPNSKTDVEQYVRQNDLQIEAVPESTLGELNVAATPTVILVDASGRVLDFWIGKLSPNEEQQLIAKVAR